MAATPRAGIAFKEPDFDNQAHAGNDTEDAHGSDSSSDDETLAAADNDKKEVKDDSPGSSNKIRSGSKSNKKQIRLQDADFGGPSHHMHPTNARLSIRSGDVSRRQSGIDVGQSPPTIGDPLKDFEVMWRSRDNRKGSIAVPVSPRGGSITMRLAFASKDAWKGTKKMFTFFPYWDMSWWSGWSYSVGSALFVVDGFWSWLPVAWPSTEFSGEAKYGVPLGFFFGALLFQIGGTMAYLEAINDGSFAGSAMKRLLIGHDQEAKDILDKKMSVFFGHVNPMHHDHKGDEEKERQKRESAVDPEAGWRNMQTQGLGRRKSTYAELPKRAPRRGGLDLGEAEEGETVEYTQWRWFPTWHRLRTHHIYEVGYVSNAIQLVGVTLYGMTSIVLLPGILDTLNEWQTNVAYWIPQLVAGSCFLIASFGFTWETQVKWWKPEFGVLGWWIGFWSVVGSVGFLLCAAFGITSYRSSGNAYQSTLSTTWGSFAYLFGSMLQWYEAVNKHSVHDLFDGPNEINAPLQPLSRGVTQATQPDREAQKPLSKEQTPCSPTTQKDSVQPFQPNGVAQNESS